MIRFRTIEPKPAANTNKPTNAPVAPSAQTAPTAGKVTLREPEAPGKASRGDKLKHD